MSESILYFRHLPSVLSDEERKDLLHHLGASQVRVMGRKGSMKNTAFASFPTKEIADQVLRDLHQMDILGSKLIVEFAKSSQTNKPSVVDNEGKTTKAENEPEKKPEIVREPAKFDTTFKVWGIKHPRRPELKYLYPPPNPIILTNISNALATVPKFYVQVLHLMNKMDLPPPFSHVTAPLELTSRDLVEQKEMEMSSETESELETDGEQEHRPNSPKQTGKRRRKEKVFRIKKPKISNLYESEVQPKSTSIPVSEVFDTPDSLVPKKISVNIVSQMNPEHDFRVINAKTTNGNKNYQSQSCNPVPSSGISSHQETEFSRPCLPDESDNVNVTSVKNNEQTSTIDEFGPALPPSLIQTSENSRSDTNDGFGKLEPMIKKREDEGENESALVWSKTTFISDSQLKRGRLSASEMKKGSVFRRYEQGQVSCRLYIKNLAKNLNEEDLHWIFGRFVNWDDESEANIYDIRLMKEGRMKGQAFVTLPSEQVAVQAVKDVNGFVMSDKPMVVQFARSAKASEDAKSIKS